MAQNEMKAKPALPERVRSMKGLGVSGFIERNEVSVWVRDGEFLVSPGCLGKRCIRVDYSVAHTLGEQGFDSLDADSATGCLSYPAICTSPEVNADGATGHDAVGSLISKYLSEAKFGTEKLDTPFYVQRRENRRCNYEFDGLGHAHTRSF